MKQEYLFIDKKFREQVEQYVNDSIQIKLFDIENTDCWLVEFSLKNNDEKAANILSDANKEFVANFNPFVLTNESSAYYNKALFPRINEFERKLRKLLYLKSALSKNNEGETTVKEINNNKETEIINNIEKLDLGEIFTLLFSDGQFVNETRKIVNNKSWQFTKEEILTALNEVEENTFWDERIGIDSVPLLRKKFNKIKEYRNDTMHAHNVDAATFRASKRLLIKVNTQLDLEINKLMENNKELLSSPSEKNFSLALSEALDEMESRNTLQEQLVHYIQNIQKTPSIFSDEMISMVEDYNKKANRLNEYFLKDYEFLPGLSALQEEYQKMANIQMQISPVLEGLQGYASLLEKNNFALSPELMQLQESLEKFNPNPTLSEIASKLNEIDKE